MPGASYRMGLAGAFVLGVQLVCCPPPGRSAQSGGSVPAADDGAAITNLAQLTHAVGAEERLRRSVVLEGVVCACSRPEMGVVVVQDGSGVELLQLGRLDEQIRAGDRIRIAGTSLFLRRRALGTQLSAVPVVDNDGPHPFRPLDGEVALKAGRIPFELDWFNGLRNFGLEVFWQPPSGQLQLVPSGVLWHGAAQPPLNSTNLAPGLHAECYEGGWERVPDFSLLRPVRTGSITNFDLGFRTRDELVGLRFTGFLDIPSDGTYSFRVASDDGALLFVGPTEAPVEKLGSVPVPAAVSGRIGEPMGHLDERRWVSVHGRVGFVSRRGGGMELELRAGRGALSVSVVEAAGLEPARLLNAYVRVVGVGRAALAASGHTILDRLAVVNSSDLQIAPFETDVPNTSLPLVAISQVQTPKARESGRDMPLRVRGVVTAARRSDRWFSLQDDTRGIFIDHSALSNTFPATAELCEVVGHTAPGNFAPIIVAEEIKRLGQGRLPEPARPSWEQLAGGGMDVQWVEFQGLVSGVQSNQLVLLLPEGPLTVRMENYFETELTQYQRAIVRIRGTLFAVWNPDNREVQFGSLLMRNASIGVDIPAPADPFDAPLKTPRELFLFDPQASALQRVKVRAQVVYAEAARAFVMDGKSGLRLLLAGAQQPLHVADTIEAVGYPEIGGAAPLLREAIVRATGAATLPPPSVVKASELSGPGLDATRVRVEATLVALHSEPGTLVLQLQTGDRLFFARLSAPKDPRLFELGSRLAVTGVYASQGAGRRTAVRADSFELLLNSPGEIVVLSKPPWWTLQRLLSVVGALLVVLMLAAAWITLLRRQVDQRTRQLQHEIRERERAERQRAVEAERSRIARDLHDDLGSSLTEISVLANTGQRRPAEGEASTLFQAIAAKARGLIAALDVIVWAVDPEDNSLQSLADYLSGFVGDFLSRSGLSARFKVPVSCPPVLLDGRVRHGVLMAVKESLNNIVRHAQATEVEFRLAVVDNALEITVVDDGKGFDPGAGRDGHGLRNLPARLGKLGGSCQVDSAPGRGTTVTMRLPLSKPAATPASPATV